MLFRIATLGMILRFSSVPLWMMVASIMGVRGRRSLSDSGLWDSLEGGPFGGLLRRIFTLHGSPCPWFARLAQKLICKNL